MQKADGCHSILQTMKQLDQTKVSNGLMAITTMQENK